MWYDEVSAVSCNSGESAWCGNWCVSDQTTSSTSATAPGSDAASGDTDPSRSWAWHQPAGTQSDGTATAAGGSAGGGGVVVYQLPATSDVAATTSSAGDAAQPPCYYSVDALGQLVQQDPSAAVTASNTTGTSGQTAAATSSLRENQLELEVLQLQSALGEKTREVEALRAQLAEAYATVERLKSDVTTTNNESTTSTMATAPALASTPPAGTASVTGADQTTASSASVLATNDAPAAPSPPSWANRSNISLHIFATLGSIERQLCGIGDWLMMTSMAAETDGVLPASQYCLIEGWADFYYLSRLLYRIACNCSCKDWLTTGDFTWVVAGRLTEYSEVSWRQ